MDEPAGIHPAYRPSHRMMQSHDIPSAWPGYPSSGAPHPPQFYAAPHPHPPHPAPYAGPCNYYPTPQILYAPPPPWYHQCPPAQPSNSYVVYNGAPDGAQTGAKAGGGGGKNQKGGDSKAHGDTGGAGSENAEGGKEDNAPSKKKGGGGQKKPIPALLNCLSNPTMQSLHYDLRDLPETATLLNRASYSHFPIPGSICNSFITAPEPLQKIKLVSRSFPWCIDIAKSSGITLETLIRELHNFLWAPTNESEYWATSDEHRARMFTAYHNNCAAASVAPNSYIGYGGALEPSIRKVRAPNDPFRRIDWFLDHTILMGLEKDDDFVSIRINDPRLREDTWVVSLGPNSAY